MSGTVGTLAFAIALLTFSANGAQAGGASYGPGARASAGCPTIAFVGVRGSGERAEQRTAEMGPEVHYMASRLRSILLIYGEWVQFVPVRYTAESTDTLTPTKRQRLLFAANPAAGTLFYRKNNARKYMASIAEGVTLLRQTVSAYAQNCPDTDLVLGGYSQGAMVIHQAELELARENDGEGLDPVVGTLLLGDGDQVPSSKARSFGSAFEKGRKATGLRPFLRGGHGAKDVPDPELTATICDEGDIVCDFSLSRHRGHYSHGKNVHTGYTKKERLRPLDSAVDWLARELTDDGSP